MTLPDDVRPLLFYIIYTPGAVRGLLPFVDTLLRWSDCTFCLVANGCGGDEERLLCDRCADEPRLSWRSLPWPQRVEHGQALNHLYAANDRAYFCFMDSDILATGNFMAELHPLLPGSAGLFSGWPITIKATERVLPDNCGFIGGRHSHTASGCCLGGSYFAIYERIALARALDAAPDGFNRGYWAQLPRGTRKMLRDMGQERHFYDTGRVLNLYLQRQGGEILVQDCAALLHLGSFSIYAGGPASQRAPQLWRKLARTAARRVRDRFNGQAYRTAVLHRVARDPVQCVVNHRRARLAGYFAEVAGALMAGTAIPEPVTVQDAEIDANVRQAREVLTAWARQQKISKT